MRLSIRTKLIGGAVLILITMAIVGWRGIAGMRDINTQLNEINSDQFEPARLIANANIGLIAWNRATLNHVLAESIQKMDKYEQIMLEQKAFVLERLQTLSNLDQLSVRGKELVRKLLDNFSKADPIRDRVVMLSRAEKQEEGRYLVRMELRSIIDHMDADMTEFLRLQERQLDETLKTTDERYIRGLWRIFFIIGSAAVVSLLIFFFLSTMIMKGVSELVRGAKLVGAGDFTQAKVSIRSKDEFGYMGAVFNEMLDSLAENLSERKQSEEQLKEYSKQLEEKIKELHDTQEQLVRQEKLSVLGQLAGGVGHELRNPLGVISNAVYYLKMVQPDADETIKEYLETISDEVNRSTQIVTDLLDLSRTRPAERERAKISELISEVLDRVSPSEKVKVATQIGSNLPDLYVDSRQIGQVLENLLTNAYQAMPEGGELIIEARAEEDKVLVSIKDKGSGISQENMEKLFEPLFTTKARGIGLGLAVSKNLVEANGGTIEVITEEGKGSTFTVILPIKEAVS